MGDNLVGMGMVEEGFNLIEAREALKELLMNKTNAGFSLDEKTAEAIVSLVKTSDDEFIKRLKEEDLSKNIKEINDKIIDKLAGKEPTSNSDKTSEVKDE